MTAGTELRAVLGRLRDLLARSGDADWAETVTRALREPDDKVLARMAQDWFTDPRGLGGLVLSPAAGHTVARCAIDAANRAFIALRRDAFALARTVDAG